MDIQTFDTGSSPKIRVKKIEGKLRVRVREGDTVEVQSEGTDKLKAKAKDGQLELSCKTDCLIFAPPTSSIEADVVHGDASLRGILGPVMVKTVGGGLNLRDVGESSAKQVGGELTARKLAGALSVDQVGGDGRIDQVAGDVRLLHVGGDLDLSRVEGLVKSTVGGDARVSFAPGAKSHSELTAGGDLRCTLPENVSARVTSIAGGDLRMAVPVETVAVAGGCEVHLGDGEADIRLTAGGNLRLRVGSESGETAAVDLGEAIAARVGAEIEAHVVDLEQGLYGLGDRMQSFDAEEIGLKIRDSVIKAQRKAAKAQRKAARRQRSTTVEAAVSRDGGDDERMMILGMLEKGKISVEEAESLLEVLESN